MATDDLLYKDARVVAPIINTTGAGAKVRQVVVDVTGTSARVNLAGSSYFSTALNADGPLDGQLFDFTADGGNVYFFFNNSDAGTADPAATTNGATVCGGVLFDGTTKAYVIPNSYTWLVVIGSGACKLRIALSSSSPNQTFGSSYKDL